MFLWYLPHTKYGHPSVDRVWFSLLTAMPLSNFTLSKERPFLPIIPFGITPVRLCCKAFFYYTVSSRTVVRFFPPSLFRAVGQMTLYQVTSAYRPQYTDFHIYMTFVVSYKLFLCLLTNLLPLPFQAQNPDCSFISAPNPTYPRGICFWLCWLFFTFPTNVRFHQNQLFNSWFWWYSWLFPLAFHN